MAILSNHIVLQTTDLDAGYGKGAQRRSVLNHINISLKTGELVCFMGPNGVGKSTLLRTLTGVQPALSGNVDILGTNLTKLSAADMATNVAMVLTDKTNAGNLTGREIVALGRYPYLGWNLVFTEEDEIKIEEAIERTNIASFCDKKIVELSDGQVQKIMIARALCQDTPIMILDEPTAHLDLNNRVEIINLLRELVKTTNKAVLMATHELDLALQSSDRLWLAGYNHPIEEGFPEDMVLNGKIDQVFELKGFDLKTGHLHKKSLGKKVQLYGEGYLYLWTKNALERTGYEIDENAFVRIDIHGSEDPNKWTITNDHKVEVSCLEELIQKLSDHFDLN